MRKISIVGVGRLGGALAIALAKKGYAIENLIVRKKGSVIKVVELIKPKPRIISPDEISDISPETVIIATQDFEIENAAAALAGKLGNKPIVFHTSGSLSSNILYELKQKGCAVGSIHPLVSVSDPVLGAERFAGAYFCVEGADGAVKIAKKIVADLEGNCFTIDAEFKPLYHAAAVTTSGHLVALFDVALEMFSKCGVEQNKGRKILLPLVSSTVENLRSQTPAQALTGTFARADVEAFERHLEVMEKNVSAQAIEVYLLLAARSLHLAERGQQNAASEKVKEMRSRILLAKKKCK